MRAVFEIDYGGIEIVYAADDFQRIAGVGQAQLFGTEETADGSRKFVDFERDVTREAPKPVDFERDATGEAPRPTAHVDFERDATSEQPAPFVLREKATELDLRIAALGGNVAVVRERPDRFRLTVSLPLTEETP